MQNNTVIINFTQHMPTAEQTADGIINTSPELHAQIKELITFVGMPTKDDMVARANALAAIYLDNHSGCQGVMIGGAPFFQSTLEAVLKKNGISCFHAISERKVVETTKDGEVIKTSVFVHTGLYHVE